MQRLAEYRDDVGEAAFVKEGRQAGRVVDELQVELRRADDNEA
jgi:hypothetical protein